MSDLHVQKRTGPGRPTGRIQVPLWSVLLLVLVVVGITLAWWPRYSGHRMADFDPATQQSTVIRYHGHEYVPVADASQHQVSIPVGQSRVVGQDHGHAIYVSTRPGTTAGGGGGANPSTAVTPGQLYLRSGNTVYVPLVPNAASQGAKAVTTP